MKNWSFFYSFWSRREAPRDRLAAAPVARFDYAQKDASCSRPRWGSSHRNRTGPVLLGSRVKPGQENQRVQWVQLHPQTVSLKTSAPWIRHLIYRMVPLLQLCHPALYLSPSLAQPAGLTPVPWTPPSSIPEPEEGSLMVFSYQCGSLKKNPTKIQRTFWRSKKHQFIQN